MHQGALWRTYHIFPSLQVQIQKYASTDRPQPRFQGKGPGNEVGWTIIFFEEAAVGSGQFLGHEKFFSFLVCA